MRLRKLTIWLFFGLLVLAGLTALLAAAGPRAEVTEIIFDFGEVFEDKELSHTFIIKNTGDAPLRIKDIDSDCACTTTEHDRTIPPGGQGRLTLTIAPYSVLRQFFKETKVTFNDPEHPLIVFGLKGYGKPAIEIQPTHIIRFQGDPGAEHRGQVRIISHLSGSCEITGYQTDIPDKIDINVKAEEPGRIYVVEVKNKSRQPGHYAGKIDLTTTSRKRPRLIIRVFADLYPPSAVSR